MGKERFDQAGLRRQSLKTGDIVLFSGNGLISNIIRWATDGQQIVKGLMLA